MIATMRNITLNQLRAFESIARKGSFQAAALELRLTQPSISQRIRELEASLGLALFVRKGPRITLTAEAHALLDYARRMLSIGAEMQSRFQATDPFHGELRIGVSENVALVCLAELLKRLEERYPSVNASVFVGDSTQLSLRLSDHALDVVIAAEPPVAPHIVQVDVGVSQLAWFAAAAYKLPRAALDAGRLAQHHLMVSPPPARAHATLMRWLSGSGVEPRRVSTCNNVAVTRLAILGGAVIGLVSARIMRADMAARTARVVEVQPPMPGHRMAICYRGGEACPALLAYVELMQELLAQFEVFAPR